MMGRVKAWWSGLSRAGKVIVVVVVIIGLGMVGAAGGSKDQPGSSPSPIAASSGATAPQSPTTSPTSTPSAMPTGTPAVTPTPAPTPTLGPTPTSAPTFLTFGDGMWEVGKDIKPGTYRLREAPGNCYWARLKGFSGSLSDIIANENAEGPTVVTIPASDKGFESNRCGIWTSDLSQVTESKTSFGEGTWIVGADIEPGKYKSEGTAGCYWARLSGFTGDLRNILANGNSDHAVIVSIGAKDKGFESHRCGIWTKQ